MKRSEYLLSLFLMLTVQAAGAQDTGPQQSFDFPRRNSIYVQNHSFMPAIYYDRVIPVSEHFGFIPKLGVESGLGYGSSLVIESSVFFGGNKHYAEIGAGRWLGTYAFTMNYRFAGTKGFLFKLGFAAGGIEFSPAVGLGYSF